jgi:hypothetical protein
MASSTIVSTEASHTETALTNQYRMTQQRPGMAPNIIERVFWFFLSFKEGGGRPSPQPPRRDKNKREKNKKKGAQWLYRATSWTHYIDISI